MLFSIIITPDSGTYYIKSFSQEEPMRFTHESIGEISDRRFSATAWAGVVLICLIALLAMCFAVKIFPDPRLPAIAGAVILIGSYVVARWNDSELTSLLALTTGAFGYAGIAGGVMIATRSIDPILIFAEIGMFAIFCHASEYDCPGKLVRDWKYSVLIAFIPELICWGLLFILQQPVFTWRLVIYAFFAGSLLFGYRFVWLGKHTLDNAIDFGLEAMLIIFWPIYRDRGGVK